MRDIRFRGKRIDNGEWVYGSLLDDFGKKTWIVNTIQDIKDAMSDNVWFEVDPSTVGQYTGLKDRNGRDIYEGDVVRLDDDDASTFSEVFYDGGALCVRSSDFTYEYDVIAIGWANENLRVDVEVIGNIHDNPELLEEIAPRREEEKE